MKILAYQFIILLFIILECMDLMIANYKAEKLRFIAYAGVGLLAVAALVVYLVGV